MIHFGQTRASLIHAIEAHAPGWHAKAALRTSAFVAAGKYEEKSSIWSEIKPVYLQLQHHKCAFCERALAASGIEHDVEHFRPKKEVKPWPTSKVKSIASSVITHKTKRPGYYWLAYDVENYSAACKDCNSIRKGNYFPIMGNPRALPDQPATLTACEQPLLPFPVTDCDPHDPENLITFDGIVPVPRHVDGPEFYRARATIDFFKLATREELIKDRFRVIREIWSQWKLSQIDPDPAQRLLAEQNITNALSPISPHTSCARSFRRLIDANPNRAWEIYTLASKA